MATIKVETDVSKEIYELLLGLAGLSGDIKKALDDGWQPGTDVPAIISAAMINLVPAIQGASGIQAELAEDKVAFAKASVLGVAEILAKVS